MTCTPHALLLALLLPLACASPRTPDEMHVMLSAPTDLGDFALVAMELLHQEGDAADVEVQRRLDELRWFGLDPRAHLLFAYDAEADRLLRFEATPAGLRRIGSFGHLCRGDTDFEDFEAERIVTELVPRGALIHALDAEGRRSPIATLFERFKSGELGAAISYESDDATRARIAEHPQGTN